MKKILTRVLAVLMAAVLVFSVMPAMALAEDINNEEEIDIDMSKGRLLVIGAEIVDEEYLISSYNGLYLLQYKDVETAKEAYKYYSETASFVAADTQISVADDSDTTPVEDSEIMTADDNPLDRILEKAGEGDNYDIALIDTGADATSGVSMIGDDISDSNGHGTKMLGAIREQAPDASVLSIKAFDASGTADVSAVYAAFEYAINAGVRIINFSASAWVSEENEIIVDEIEKAVSSGIIVVGAAGNNGVDTSYTVPGCAESAYIIGAAAENGERLASSNYGTDYNVVADSSSDAAARFSGFIAKNGIGQIAEVLNKKDIYEDNYTAPEMEDTVYTLDTSLSGDFYVSDAITVQNYSYGSGDVLFYTDSLTRFGSYWPAYCIDHSARSPRGNPYDSGSISGTTLDRLGYVMKHGYPNDNFGLAWDQAQYITQAVVFGIMGGHSAMYEPSGGVHSPAWIYADVFGYSYEESSWSKPGNFQKAEDLYNAAISNASSADAEYALIYNPSSDYASINKDEYQRMLVPKPYIPNGYITLQKNSSEGSASDLDGAVFDVYNDETNTYIGSFITGKGGKGWVTFSPENSGSSNSWNYDTGTRTYINTDGTTYYTYKWSNDTALEVAPGRYRVYEYAPPGNGKYAKNTNTFYFKVPGGVTVNLEARNASGDHTELYSDGNYWLKNSSGSWVTDFSGFYNDPDGNWYYVDGGKYLSEVGNASFQNTYNSDVKGVYLPMTDIPTPPEPPTPPEEIIKMDPIGILLKKVPMNGSIEMGSVSDTRSCM